MFEPLIPFFDLGYFLFLLVIEEHEIDAYMINGTLSHCPILNIMLFSKSS